MAMEKPIWWDYAERWPCEDEPGYDGVHDGGIKGLRKDAPLEAKKEYEKVTALEKQGWRL